MSVGKQVRFIDKVKWMPSSLILTSDDMQTGLHLMKPRYFTGLGPITPDSPMGKDYALNLANTEFEVNQFLADMISQPKG